MKVLIACEFSGIVREAFRSKGHDAWSCDLLPTEIPGDSRRSSITIYSICKFLALLRTIRKPLVSIRNRAK